VALDPTDASFGRFWDLLISDTKTKVPRLRHTNFALQILKSHLENIDKKERVPRSETSPLKKKKEKDKENFSRSKQQ
jgi:hypothetical protein